MDRKRREATRSTGENDSEQRARHLVELMRSGEIKREKVEFAAFLGDEPARMVIEYDEGDIPEEATNVYDVAGQVEFFQYINHAFGHDAMISMFQSSLKELQDLVEAYMKLQSLDSAQSMKQTIGLLDQIIIGDWEGNDSVESILSSIQQDIINVQNSVPKTNVDRAYALAPLEMAKSLLESLAMKTDSLPGESFDDFVSHLSQNYDTPPSDELLETVSEQLMNEIDDIGLDVDNTGERERNVIDFLLRIMQRGALKWALKDVK